MKYVVPAFAALALSITAAPALAAGTPCDDVKSQIAQKLDAKGVVGYTLTAVPNADVKPDEKVVGVCEGGTMKITYVRGGGAAKAEKPAKEEKAAEKPMKEEKAAAKPMKEEKAAAKPEEKAAAKPAEKPAAKPAAPAAAPAPAAK